MKLSIKRTDCKFYVNEKKRTVVCVIPNTVHLLQDFLDDNDWSICSRLAWRELELPASFTGIARCAPDDEWDEERGKTLAYTKARDHLYRCFFKRANYAVELYDDNINTMIMKLNDMGERVASRQEQLYNQIKEY